MPALTRQQRAAGARIFEGRGRRHYTRDDLATGRYCDRCGHPIVRQLLAAEPDTRLHPGCDQEPR